MNLRPASLLALPVLAAAALGACSSAGEQVADQIAEQVGEVLEIDAPPTTCPDDAEAGDGNTFDCDVEVEDQELVASVTFTSDDEFTFEFDSDVFATGDLEARVRAGEAVVAFDLPAADLDVDWPLSLGKVGMKIKADRNWVVSLDYPSGGAIWQTVNLITGRKKAKAWKGALAGAGAR